MTQFTQPFDEFQGANWNILGEAKFPVGITTTEMVHAWLVDTLRPLNLNARFLEKILASAQLAAERSIFSADKQDSNHVHMLIFMPVETPSNGQSWGFFRVDKQGDPPVVNQTLDHSIAFYLYLEGT